MSHAICTRSNFQLFLWGHSSCSLIVTWLNTSVEHMRNRQRRNRFVAPCHIYCQDQVVPVQYCKVFQHLASSLFHDLGVFRRHFPFCAPPYPTSVRRLGITLSKCLTPTNWSPPSTCPRGTLSGRFVFTKRWGCFDEYYWVWHIPADWHYQDLNHVIGEYWFCPSCVQKRKFGFEDYVGVRHTQAAIQLVPQEHLSFSVCLPKGLVWTKKQV